MVRKRANAKPPPQAADDADALAYLAAFYEQLPFAVDVFDRRGHCVGRNAASLATGGPPDAEVQAAALSVFSGKSPTLPNVRLMPLRNADGMLRYVAAVQMGDGASSAALELERSSRVAAETASRLKDEFLALVSHELRTPLNSVLGWASMMRSRKLDASAMDKALDSIERNSRVLVRLVDDLLDLGRIISGKLQLTFQRRDLNTVALAAAEVVRSMAEGRSISLDVQLAKKPIELDCDPDRMQQVIWNLLVNAVKFTPSGGHVWLSTRVEDDVAYVTVRDSGQGISASFLPFLFERFRQADQGSTRRQGGLGLGLAFVRHVVELHGGTVKAESPGANRGSTFTVALPLPRATASS